MDFLVECISNSGEAIIFAIINFHQTVYTLIILSLFQLDINNYYKFLEFYLGSFIKYIPKDIISFLTIVIYYIALISIFYLIYKMKKLLCYNC